MESVNGRKYQREYEDLSNMPDNLIMFSENRQFEFFGKVREKSQVTVDNNIVKIYDINQGDTIICKVVGIKKKK